MLWLVILLVISCNMHITDCENPQRVYNKYLGEYVWTSCGKCNTCKKRKASRWVARLEVERSQHLVSFFVTLTYADEWLPILAVDPNEDKDKLIDWRHDVQVSVSKDLTFLTASDKMYFDMRIAQFKGIPYVSVEDIQKFHKRLNKYFHDKVSKKWQNFRFFTVTEYGSTTLRPHIHSIYFVDDRQVADCFEEGVCSCWKYGISTTEPVLRSATSYVAQYLNELFELPSFYKDRPLRPFFLCSKRPPIGCFAECEESYKEIFDNGVSYRVVPSPTDSSKFVDVPLLRCVESRLFPKVKGFNFIPHSLRVALYRCCCGQYDKGLPYLRSFTDFICYVQGIVKLNPLSHVVSMLSEYFSCICHCFTDKGYECLKRLYYISKRVVRQAFAFGYTLEDYVSKIEDYWNAKEIYVLRKFYEFQQGFTENSEFLVYCYPEYCYNINKKEWRDLSLVSLPSLEDCCDFNTLVSVSADKYDKLIKSHFKNSYFESMEFSNSPLFHILNLYYAQKRYEIAQACCQSSA